MLSYNDEVSAAAHFTRQSKELIAVLNAHAVAFREDGVVKLRFRSLLRETVVDYRPRPTNPLCSESGHP
jgi:hypothetical protein